jgi:hypothetical protein
MTGAAPPYRYYGSLAYLGDGLVLFQIRIRLIPMT